MHSLMGSFMTDQGMAKAQAKMEILVLNAEADGVKSSNFYAWLRRGKF
mgnify:CR=1 FL=1